MSDNVPKTGPLCHSLMEKVLHKSCIMNRIKGENDSLKVENVQEEVLTYYENFW
jgi:hypothetical protein